MNTFEIILMILSGISGIILGYGITGLTSSKEKTQTNYPNLTGTNDLANLQCEKSTWNGMALHSYFLEGNKYQLNKMNISIDKCPNQRWNGINQCLFYMSDEAIPNKPEINEARLTCNVNLRPWKADFDIQLKKSGRYFIIAFTNNHDFVAEGNIEIENAM